MCEVPDAEISPILRVLAGTLLGIVASVALAVSGSADEGRATRPVHVVSNGWHTAIVLRKADVVETGVLPEAADFPNAVYLEFGWGDREYYTASEATLELTLRAGLTPTPAVMHVAGRARGPRGPAVGRSVESIKLSVPDFRLRNLVSAIAQDFERPEGDRAQPISAGLTRNSFFYNAKGEFHLFNTCNTWTAEKLNAAGIGLTSSGVVTAADLMNGLRAALADE